MFKLKENKTTIFTEFIAGLTTFMTMSYVIFVVPSILTNCGMQYEAVYGATIITSIIGTLFLGLFANVPYAQSAGIGLASLFSYTICGALGYTWEQGLAMVFICAFIKSFQLVLKLLKKGQICNKILKQKQLRRISV